LKAIETTYRRVRRAHQLFARAVVAVGQPNRAVSACLLLARDSSG